MPKTSMDCKKSMVKELASRFKDKTTLIVTNYKGLTAQALNELRKEIKDIGAEYVVVKGSIAKRAFGEGINNSLSEFIEGEVGIAIDNKEDATYISKILVRFAKSQDFLEIRCGIMGGETISVDNIKELALLPSREVLLAKLAGVLNSPVQGIASALHGILSKLVCALDAVKDRKDKTTETRKDGDTEKKN